MIELHCNTLTVATTSRCCALSTTSRSVTGVQAGLPDALVSSEFDVRTDKPLLRVSRHLHGNLKCSVITQDFVHGADYATLCESAQTFRGLLWALGPG